MSTVLILPTIIAGAIETVPAAANLPVTESIGAIRYAIANSTLYTFDGTSWNAISGGGGGGVAWGAITGTLSAQTDLQSALNAKQNSGNYVTALTGDVTASGPGSAAATVALVGGASAANVASATTLALAATASDTASTIVLRDSSGNFAAGTITANLTGNASGTAASVTGVVTIAHGGTNSSTALNNNRIMISSGGTISEFSAITANRALASNGSGLPVASATTDTELAFVSGVTSAIQTQLNARVLISAVGAANGVASLDSGGKVPTAQLPSTVMLYLGAWNASTNSPTLADGTGVNGDVYRASVAGTQNLGSGSQTWAIGDFAIYNGSIWQHSPAADGVTSVNGLTGAVVLTGAAPITVNPTTGVVAINNVSQTVAGAVASAGQLLGTNTSDNAGTGYVGEEVVIIIPSSSAVTLTSAATTNVFAPFTLSAGDWDISGDFATTLGSVSATTSTTVAVSASSGTLPASSTMFAPNVGGEKSAVGLLANFASDGYDGIAHITPYRVSLATSTTFYGVIAANFTGSMFGYGMLRARRIR